MKTRIRFTGLLIAEIRKDEATIHFVAEHSHQVRITSHEDVIGPALNCEASFELALVDSKCKGGKDDKVPLAGLRSLTTYDVEPQSKLEVLDAARHQLKFSNHKINTAQQPTEKNYENLRWLPDAYQLLGHKRIDPGQISSSFVLTDGHLSAGWTSVREWEVKKDNEDDPIITRFFANHLLFEPATDSRTIIKSNHGWLVVEGDGTKPPQITVANLPRSSAGLSMNTMPSSVASRHGYAGAEVNHYNQYQPSAWNVSSH